MATINFYLDKADRKGLAPIHLRINCNGSQMKLATGKKILSDQFDKKKQRATGLSIESAEINHYLKFLEDRANELLQHSAKNLLYIGLIPSYQHHLPLDCIYNLKKIM
jgi:DNA (cytosine-5)-methyltransferase 1